MQWVPAEKISQKDTSRIEAFSDGIFCVAITLLAIEVGVDVKSGETNQTLLHSLIDLWPKYLAYFISFVNVLLAWIGHHSLFKNMLKTDHFVMMSNGLLLMLVALVPFPTRTLGLFLLTGAFKAAVVFYTGYFVLISLAFSLLWYAASRKREFLNPHLSANQIKTITRNEYIGLISNCFIMLVSFVSPWIALVLSFVMWVYWLVIA